MCNERITGGLVAEREQPGLASTMWGTLNLDGAPHQIFAGIHHPGDKSVAQPKFESKPFFSKMYVCHSRPALTTPTIFLIVGMKVGDH